MKKKIAILGSTGSIGKTLFEIIKKDKKNFEVILLTADKNYKEILKQAKILKVKNIINGKNENINEPIVPDIVLFGLIFDNFLPPINFPKTYPPISVRKHMLIMYRKKIGPSDL